MANVERTTLKQLTPIVEALMLQKIVAMISGSPGIGKSGVVHAIAEKHNLKLIDIRLSECDPTDIMGFPTVDEAKNKSMYRPMATFPLKGDELPWKEDEKGQPLKNAKGEVQYYAGWLLFLDEFKNGDPSVQRAAYKLVLDRKVGLYDLHDECKVVCAGNLASDKAMVQQMSTALVSRMGQFEVELSVDDWLEWADSAGIDHRIKAYVGWKREAALYTFDPKKPEDVYACPRTWEMTSKMIKGKQLRAENADDRVLINAFVGNGLTRDFLAYTELFNTLLKVEDIIKNPEGVDIDMDMSVQWAYINMLPSHVTDETLEPIVKFIKRMHGDLQIVAIRQINQATGQKYKFTPLIKEWAQYVISEFMS